LEDDIFFGIFYDYSFIADLPQQIDTYIYNSTERAGYNPPVIIFGRATEFDHKITEYGEYDYPYHRHIGRIS